MIFMEMHLEISPSATRRLCCSGLGVLSVWASYTANQYTVLFILVPLKQHSIVITINTDKSNDNRQLKLSLDTKQNGYSTLVRKITYSKLIQSTLIDDNKKNILHMHSYVYDKKLYYCTYMNILTAISGRDIPRYFFVHSANFHIYICFEKLVLHNTNDLIHIK